MKKIMKFISVKIIVAIIFTILISHANSVKLRACDKIIKQTHTIPSFSESTPDPKYFRNVGNFKCLTGVEEGADVALSFCQVGNKHQIWSFIGYKDKPSIYTIQNIKDSITVMDAPCGIQEESPIRLWITNYQNHQMFKFEMKDEKLGHYRITSFNNASLCLSSKSSLNEEGLFQVKCNEEDINQRWTFLDPLKPFDKNWIAFYPKLWGKDKILSLNKVDSKNANFKSREKTSDADRFLRGNSWIFTSVPNSNSFYISVDAGYAIYAHNDNFAYLYLNEEKEWYQWDVILVADYVISLRNPYYDKCLTFSNNDNVGLSDCNYEDNQRIYYHLADLLPNTNSFTIQEVISSSESKCIEVQKYDAPLKHRLCTNNNGFQGWKSTLNTDGSFTFMSAYGGIFICQRYDCKSECIYSTKYYDSSNRANRWYIVPVKEGSYVLINQYQREELKAKPSEEYTYSNPGTTFKFVPFIYGKPRKTPFYSITNKDKLTIRYAEKNFSPIAGSLLGKDATSAFKLLLNPDKTYSIEFINGWLLGINSNNQVTFTSAQDKNAKIKWVILPFDELNVIINYDTAKCLKIVSTSLVSAVDCTPSTIIKDNLQINYILNSAPEIPSAYSAILNFNVNANKTYRLKLTPQNIIVDGTSGFQTTWKIERIKGTLYSKIISNSGIPLQITPDSKSLSTNGEWMIWPTGPRTFAIVSSNNQYLNFNYGDIKSGLNKTIVANLSPTLNTPFIFFEDDANGKLDKGLYTISSGSPNDAKSTYLSLEGSYFQLKPKTGNPRIYMRIIENPEKKTFMITASNGIVLDKPLTTKGLNAISYDDTKTTPQAKADSSTEWFLIFDSEETYYIAVRESGKNLCLTKDSSNKLFYTDCIHGEASQKFSISPASATTFDTCNYFYLKTRDNLCLHSYSFEKYIKHVICQENDASLAFKFSSEGNALYKIKSLAGQFISLDSSNGLAKIEDESSNFIQSWELEIEGTDTQIFYKLKVPNQNKYNPFTYYLQPIRGITLIPKASEKIRIVTKPDLKCLLDNSTTDSGLKVNGISFDSYTDKDTKKCLIQLEQVPKKNTYFIKSLIGNGLYLYATSNSMTVFSGFLDQDESKQDKNEWYIAPIDFDFYHIIHKETRLCLSHEGSNLSHCDLSNPNLIFDFLGVDSNSPAGKDESAECGK